MTSTPRKRPSNPEWETRSALKALRILRPNVAEPAAPRGDTFRVGSQPVRALLDDLQLRQHPASTTPSTAPQEKPSHGKRFSSTYQSPPESRLGPQINTPSLHTAAAHQIVHDIPNMSAPPRPSPYTPVNTLSSATSIPWGKPYKPAVRHAPHPDSRLCQNFHWVPYPLGLLPYDSWFKMHHRPEHTENKSALCPACLKERKVPSHTRKMFLVAERLSWEDGITSVHDKSLNEELNWAVNYELGILDPFVEDPEHVPGGKNSRTNSFYPYQNEYEMKLAFKYIFMTENVSETTWALWIGTQLDLQKMLGGDERKPSLKAPKLHEDGLRILEKKSTRPKTPEIETIDLTDSPPPKSRPAFGIPTPPSSFKKVGECSRTPAIPFTHAAEGASFARPPSPAPYFDQCRRIVSYKTLQDFYGLLDRIERTSYVGAVFLEAYAEKLRDDLCKACWLKRNVDLDSY